MQVLPQEVPQLVEPGVLQSASETWGMVFSPSPPIFLYLMLMSDSIQKVHHIEILKGDVRIRVTQRQLLVDIKSAERRALLQQLKFMNSP